MELIVDIAKEDDVESIVKLIDNWLSEMKWSWPAEIRMKVFPADRN